MEKWIPFNAYQPQMQSRGKLTGAWHKMSGILWFNCSLCKKLVFVWSFHWRLTLCAVTLYLIIQQSPGGHTWKEKFKNIPRDSNAGSPARKSYIVPSVPPRGLLAIKRWHWNYNHCARSVSAKKRQFHYHFLSCRCRSNGCPPGKSVLPYCS
jgi:hypothetical protein